MCKQQLSFRCGDALWVISPLLLSPVPSRPCWLGAVMIARLLMGWGQIFPSGGCGRKRASPVSGVVGVSLRNSLPVPARFLPSGCPAQFWEVWFQIPAPGGFPRPGKAGVEGNANAVSGCWGGIPVAFPGTKPGCPGAGTYLELTASVGSLQQQEEAGRAGWGQ